MIESGWRRLRHFWRPRVRDEVDDEMSFHFAMRIDQFVAEGMTRTGAHRRASAQFGDVDEVRTKLVSIDALRRRRMALWDTLDGLLLDARCAIRSLRAHWALSLTIIGTLAVAIGATTAIFSVVDAVLIRPLPYGDASRLGALSMDLHIRGGEIGFPPGYIPELRAGAPDLDFATFTIAPYQPFEPPAAPPRPITLAGATTNLFDVLQVPVVLGRNFMPADGTPNAFLPAAAPGATPSVRRPLLPIIGILGYDFWQRQFHGDSSVIGKTIVVARGPIQIVGVASPRAELLTRTGRWTPDVWAALRMDFNRASRQEGTLLVLGRVKPGIAFDQAQRQVDHVGAEFRSRYPLLRSAGAYLRLDPIRAFLVRDVRPPIVALMGAVTFFLLIACANVVSLVFVRAAQRERELAVRSAIGGSPWRIVRQLLIENLLLAAVAALVGVMLAAIGVPILARLAPWNVPRLVDVSFDHTVLFFALAITSAVFLVVGLIPALRVWKPPVGAVLRTSTRTTAFGTAARLRATMAVTEVALSFVLLVGCGLMLRSFVAVTRADLGFDPSGVLTFRLTNRLFRNATEASTFVQRVHDALADAPGVTSATMSFALPLTGGDAPGGRWGTTAALTDSTLFRAAAYRLVLPDYFKTMRIPVLAGRTFADNEDAVAAHVIVIDSETARLSFGRESAVGKPLVARVGSAETSQEYTVIGVVKHERYARLLGVEKPAIYFPEAIQPNAGGFWIVRTTGDPMAIVPSVRAAIARVDPALFIDEIKPMSAFVDQARAPTRFALTLIGIFAAIAATLAAVGLYGVLSSLVRLRTTEIGIRMALGADRRRIFALIIGRGFRLAAIGLAAGILLALAATRVMGSLLYGVQPTDPATFAVMSVLLLGVAGLAAWVPARRAAALDPTAALREE